ncbi:MAG: hypothetical protein IJ655_06490 [Lachnospiraceae bacterium]|nr:hypothetical protein [Lachnospiraceae bacterium]
MDKYIDLIDENCKLLWQAKAVDEVELINMINGSTEEMMEGVKKMLSLGIQFPVQYVTDGLRHFEEAIQSQDNYKLADFLCFEWKEILTVYDEIIAEM